jgi:FdhE protein
MRQGEVAPRGKWTGQAQGGVSAPDPLILADPTKRFADTAERLEVLAPGHPMEAWLRFMADLAEAQHVAAAVLSPPLPVERAHLAQVVEARLPPIGAETHQRDPAWQDGFATILHELADVPLPEAARWVVAGLQQRPSQDIESLADAFLRGRVPADCVGEVLYIAAALQVYFTRLAASLPTEALRLLPQRGLCPCCGSTPVTGLVVASGRTPGTRYLTCSLCATAWNHVRTVCINCGGSRGLSLKSIEGDNGAIRAETCDDCHTYAKMLYQAKDTKVDPFADDLATLALDVLVAEAGWARHAPNPLLMMQ